MHSPARFDAFRVAAAYVVRAPESGGEILRETGGGGYPLIMALDGGAGDRELVGRLQRREPQALAELYDRYGAELYSRMWRTAGKRGAAEDLVQETLLRAWNRIHDFDAETNRIEPWLLAIAHDTAPYRDDSDIPAPAAPPPSPKLRRRILASAGHERFGWAPFLAAAAVLAISAAVYFGGRERTFALEVLNLREQMRQQNIALTRFNEALSILNGTGTVEAPFTPGEARGKVFVNAQQGVLLIASNLTPAPPGKVFEMWLVTKNGKSAPAGLFQARRDGTALHVERGEVDVASAASVVVTLEDEGGAAQPGPKPLITAYLLSNHPDTFPGSHR